jgi:transposase
LSSSRFSGDAQHGFQLIEAEYGDGIAREAVYAAVAVEHVVERARIMLLAAAGMASRAIARELGCRHRTVSKWRVRFARDRLAGLADAPRSGKPKTYGEDAGRGILALLDRPPPAGFARWTAPLLADVSDHHVWRRSGQCAPARPGKAPPIPLGRHPAADDQLRRG